MPRWARTFRISAWKTTMIPKTRKGRNVRSSQLTVSRFSQERGPVEHDEDERPQRHLHRVGAADELQELVDDEGHEQDVHDVPPVELRGGEEGRQTLEEHLQPPPDRVSRRRTTCTISATSWTRTMWAPPRTAAATAAAVPKSRSPTGRSRTLPMKLFREGPTRMGRSRTVSSGSRRSTSRLWPASLAKPMPGSTIMHSRPIPASSPRTSARPSSSATSPITSA